MRHEVFAARAADKTSMLLTKPLCCKLKLCAAELRYWSGEAVEVTTSETEAEAVTR